MIFPVHAVVTVIKDARSKKKKQENKKTLKK